MSIRVEAPTPDQLRALARPRLLYKPDDVADDLGVSHDCVIDALNKRPGLFPPPEPGFKRRREWTSYDAFIAVMFVLCSISTHAAKSAHSRLTGLEDPKRKSSGKKAENPLHD